MKRVFLIVLDSFGVGEMPDADHYGDKGSNTLRAASESELFYMPNMKKLGLFQIEGVEIHEKNQWAFSKDPMTASVARMTEASAGKDTTIGHWEIAGVISREPLPTFPNGFPQVLLEELTKRTGRKILCNQPYSGTDVIKDYGQEHMETGSLIVYTSADSVLQIAAHEAVVPIEQLYQYCEIAREVCQGNWGVGRVIARPFEGECPNFVRTSRRHDYSLIPPADTMLDILLKEGKEVIAVGKISDIFAGKGIKTAVRTKDNEEGIQQTLQWLEKDFEGICFINLVDFDMKYGHRNDVEGYARALSYFDQCLPEMLGHLRKEDVLMITADHGCDPLTPSTDHSREYTPLVVYGESIKAGINLGTRESFADIAATILDYFQVKTTVEGKSFLSNIIRRI